MNTCFPAAQMVCNGPTVKKSKKKEQTDKSIFLSVCKNQILSNLKHGTNIPVIRTSRGPYGRAHRKRAPLEYKNIDLVIRYQPDNPSPWGARVWLEITER